MRFTTLVAAWAVFGFRRCFAAAFGAALCCVGVRVQAACNLDTITVPVRLVNSRPVATVTVNGTDLTLLVDSGAFFSLLTTPVAAQLGLSLRSLPFGYRLQGYTGRIDAKLTRVDSVKLQKLELPNVEFIVGGNDLGSGIQGLLGRNFLAMADTEYDLASGVVRIVFPKGDCNQTNFAYWAGDAPVIVAPLDTGREGTNTAIQVEVKLNGKAVKALLDTGAVKTALKLKAARRVGLDDSELALQGFTGGAGQGKARSWLGSVRSFELGGEQVENNLFHIDDTDNVDIDLLIGLDYFMSHRIYVSRLQRKLYATWNGSPIFARNAADGVYDLSHAAAPTAPAVASDWAHRAAMASARGEHEAAVADLGKAIDLEPNVASHRADRAKTHIQLRSMAAALADLDHALGLDPTLVEARVNRASLRAAAGNRTGAVDDLNVLDAALPDSASWRVSMGNTFAALDLAPEALRQWDLWAPTHLKDARMASVLNSRCWLRVRLNIELSQAHEDCQAAADKDAQSNAIQDSLGWLYLRQGDAARAQRAFERALSLKPKSPWSLYGRALALQCLGKVQDSEADLAAARASQPKMDRLVRQAGFGALLTSPDD